MKKTIALALLALGTVCSAYSPVQASDLKIAAVLPGVISDGAFNQQVHTGLVQARDRSGAEIAFSEKVPTAAQIETMSDYARRGYKIIIGAGGEYVDPAKRIVARFPDVQVVVLNGAATEGVVTINFDNVQFGYAVGLVAGRSTKTGKAAAISARPIPAFEEVVKGFRSGFQKARPDGEVVTTLTNDWSDIAKAKEATLNLNSQGADIFLPYLDGAQLGVIQGAKERGAHVVGLAVDLSVQHPETNLFSTVTDFGAAVAWVAEQAKKGQLENKNYLFGLGTEPGYLGGYNPSVPKDVRDEVDAAIADFKSGALKVE